MALGEITDQQRAAWSVAEAWKLKDHSAIAGRAIDLADALTSVLARALKAEFESRCFRFDMRRNPKNRNRIDHARLFWTDADWLAEAERILRKNR